MLGNGVYFSNILDKVSQYVGRTDITRKHDTTGYILECEIYLGKNGEHYRAAGLGTDVIKSPEWCVFYPGNQIRIYRVHQVVLVPKKDILDLVEKYKDRLPENANESKAFKNMRGFMQITEKVTKRNDSDKILYKFADGLIPDTKGNVVPYRIMMTRYKHLNIYGSQEGICIEFDAPKNKDWAVHIIPSADDFILDQKDDYQDYVELLKTAILQK